MLTAGVAGLWIADVIAAASLESWSRAALRDLIARIAIAVDARNAGIWVGEQSAEWVSAPPRLGGGEILEFRSGGDGDVDSHVELFIDVDDPSIQAQELLESFGQLLCQAVRKGGPSTQVEMRASLLRRRLQDISLEHQAGGLLAERFRTSIEEGVHRLRRTAERFEISVSGFSAGLIGSGQVHDVTLDPGYRSSSFSG
jgi:hypothetical protein